MKFNFLVFLSVLLIATGCTSSNVSFFKPTESSIALRQIQSRTYETADEAKILSSVIALMQDTGFIIEKSDDALGFVSVTKNADAVKGGQVALALTLDVLNILSGSGYSDNLGDVDDVQKINASVVVKPNSDGKSYTVRLTYQRMVWNKKGILSKVETLNDKEMYNLFFDKLSKSIFLEENKI